MLLAHPDERQVLPMRICRSAGRSRLVCAARPADALREYTDAQGISLVTLAYPIPLLKSAVVVQQPKADVYASLEKMRRQFILWALVSVVVFMALAVAVAWRIFSRCVSCARPAEQWAAEK